MPADIPLNKPRVCLPRTYWVIARACPENGVLWKQFKFYNNKAQYESLNQSTVIYPEEAYRFHNEVDAIHHYETHSLDADGWWVEKITLNITREVVREGD